MHLGKKAGGGCNYGQLGKAMAEVKHKKEKMRTEQVKRAKHSGQYDSVAGITNRGLKFVRQYCSLLVFTVRRAVG